MSTQFYLPRKDTADMSEEDADDYTEPSRPPPTCPSYVSEQGGIAANNHTPQGYEEEEMELPYDWTPVVGQQSPSPRKTRRGYSRSYSIDPWEGVAASPDRRGPADPARYDTNCMTSCRKTEDLTISNC